MSLTTIRVSEADFNPGEEIERLIESSPEAGGVASFVGVVRNRNDGNDVTHLTLEHYPAMTERALAGIVERARAPSPGSAGAFCFVRISLRIKSRPRAAFSLHSKARLPGNR